MGILSVMLCPLWHAFIVINGIIIIHVVQLTIAQEAWLGAVVAEVAVPIVYIAETHGAPIVWSQAHVSIVPLTMAQDTIVPLGALFVDMIGTVFLALATVVEAVLALTPSTLQCVLVALLLGYVSDGGIINEGGTDSIMITPCCSSSVAVVGMVVVTSLVMSPYGMINMATIVCSS
jgi:hypothetical protein